MINIAEILKDCPKRTKLYSPIFGEGWLSEVGDYLIKVYDNNANDYNFYHNGSYVKTGECMLFPSKDNRDWNTFHRPFQDGDVISNNSYIAIFHKFGKPKSCEYDKVIYYHCWCYQNGKEFKFKKDFGIGRDTEYKFATDKEKQKLFDIIKANGYKWNSETKTLEKMIIPKFKVGDEIVKKDDPTKSWYVQGIDTYCNSDYYSIVTKSQVSNLHFKDQDEWELVPTYKFKVGDKITNGKVTIKIGHIDGDYYYDITRNIANRLFIKFQDEWELAPTPKFKVGDRIKYKKHDIKYRIINEENDMYIVERCTDNFTCHMSFKYVDDEYELVPNKFDISTLKAYDKVLVRDSNEREWFADLFSHVLDRPLGGYAFGCVGHTSKQCIPYLGNEHLLGTYDDCDEYYKNW